MSEAISYANARPDEEITFLLEEGEYGVLTDVITNNRTSWLTIKPMEGKEVIFDYINIRNGMDSIDAYLNLENIIVNSYLVKGSAEYKTGVFVYKANHMNLINITVNEKGYFPNIRPGDGSIGIEIGYSNNINVIGCLLEGETDLPESGYESGIKVEYSLNVLIQNSYISRSRFGVVVSGENITIDGNVLQDLESDGVIIEGQVNNVNVKNNIIHDLYPTSRKFNVDATYDNTTRTLEIISGDELPEFLSYYVRIELGNGESYPGPEIHYGYWPQIESHDSNTIVFKDTNNLRWFTENFYENIKSIEVVEGYHCDCIQTQMTSSPNYDIVIDNNTCYNSNRHAFTLQPDETYNLILKNNLVYDTESTAIQIMTFQNVSMWNNTILGDVWLRNDVTVNEIVNNILGETIYYSTMDLEKPVNENKNIVLDFGSSVHLREDFIKGENTFSFEDDEESFKNLFMDYDNEDFNVLTSSIACDGNVNGMIGVAVGALPCV